jgi:hypothetical protein
VGLTKLLVETQLTCGPNEDPDRNKVIWSFTCEPNEAPGRNQIGLLPVGLTKFLVEALSRGFGCLCFYAFEKYWKIIWLTWYIM